MNSLSTLDRYYKERDQERRKGKSLEFESS